METQSALSLKNLEFSFGNATLFSGVNLEVGSHEFVTIMGRNGSGKSTLISMLLGALVPVRGAIEFWGQDSRTVNRAELGQRIAWVVSEREYYPPLYSVGQLFRDLSAFFPLWDKALEKSLCEGFGIDTRKALRSLSLGEAAKVKLIKAMAIRPRLIVLDELTANLDPQSKEVITRAIIQLFAECAEMSVLYISHSDEEALRLSDRIFQLEPTGLRLSA